MKPDQAHLTISSRAIIDSILESGEDIQLPYLGIKDFFQVLYYFFKYQPDYQIIVFDFGLVFLSDKRIETRKNLAARLFELSLENQITSVDLEKSGSGSGSSLRKAPAVLVDVFKYLKLKNKKIKYLTYNYIYINNIYYILNNHNNIKYYYIWGLIFWDMIRIFDLNIIKNNNLPLSSFDLKATKIQTNPSKRDLALVYKIHRLTSKFIKNNTLAGPDFSTKKLDLFFDKFIKNNTLAGPDFSTKKLDLSHKLLFLSQFSLKKIEFFEDLIKLNFKPKEPNSTLSLGSNNKILKSKTESMKEKRKKDNQKVSNLVIYLKQKIEQYNSSIGANNYFSQHWENDNKKEARKMLKHLSYQDIKEAIDWFFENEFWRGKVDNFKMISKHYQKFVSSKNNFNNETYNLILDRLNNGGILN